MDTKRSFVTCAILTLMYWSYPISILALVFSAIVLVPLLLQRKPPTRRSRRTARSGGESACLRYYVNQRM